MTDKKAHDAIEEAARRLLAGIPPQDLEGYNTAMSQFDLSALWRRIARTTHQNATSPSTRKNKRRWLWVAAAAAVVAVVLTTMPSRREALIYSSQQGTVELAVGDGAAVALEKAEVAVGGNMLANDTVSAMLHYRSISTPAQANPDVTLSTPRGSNYSIVLPDGTRVHLNSQTTITFPDRFDKDSRDVQLAGEAFFEVAPDATRPLRVHVGDVTVTALGTEFNVDATGEGVNAALLSGVVEVSNAQASLRLAPGQLCEASGDNLIKREADVHSIASWRAGRVRFVGWTMERIAQKMALWYDFDLRYDDPAIATMRFSGTIDKQRPLNELLELLQQTGALQFEIRGRHITAKQNRKHQTKQNSYEEI